MSTEVSLEKSLEHCLQELARTNDVETSLRRHPQHADRLRPLLETAQMTRRHFEAVPEAPNGLVASRERLLAIAAQQRAQRGPAIAPGQPSVQTMRSLWVRRFAALLAAVLSLAVVFSGAVWAASDSLPGDWLYPLKLAVEDARLALASGPGAQVDLALQFTQERTNEIEALVAAGRQVPEETVARMEKHITRALAETAGASDDEMPRLLAQIAERTLAQTQILERIQTTASEQAQAGLDRATTACLQGAQAAEEGLKDPQTFRQRYRHRERTPGPTHTPQATVAPGHNQGQEQKRERTPEGPSRLTPEALAVTPTPLATSQGSQATTTPRGPQMTVTPEPTPRTPRDTAKPNPTGSIPQATITPQGIPQGPSMTSPPEPTPEIPQGTSPGPQMTSSPQKPGEGHGSGP